VGDALWDFDYPADDFIKYESDTILYSEFRNIYSLNKICLLDDSINPVLLIELIGLEVANYPRRG